MKEINFGEIIYFHRKKSGLTQKQLADLAGIGKTVVFDVEKGKKTVRLDSLMKIFTVLNIKIELNSPLMHLMEKPDEKS